MSTSEKEKCGRCGAVVPSGSSEMLCPACLMSGALEPPGSRAETVVLTEAGSLAIEGPSEFPFEFGGYCLLGLLGRGGMGTVYEAEHAATGRRVALKMLGQELDSPEMRQRFLREGRLAAGVSHPNSLYIFGSEEIENIPVITMEIADSGTLKDKLKKRGPLPIAEAVDAILDVIAGLEAGLAEGVLHRDIKPSNCFVGPDGSVKIGDFGLSVSTLARDDSYITASGVIMGTPAFASPEQLRGDSLDVRADIYSVGATLFTLLTGRAPFEGNNAVQVVANAVNQKPKNLSKLREDVPPILERVVARCLAKEPGQRYADYMALRNVLLPFSSKEPEPASLAARSPAGWIDYLAAFLTPYVILMLSIGNEQFHLGFLMERTLFSARHYIAFLAFGLLYFTVAEGIWGAGLGKRLKGLVVVRKNGRLPGLGRAFLRILLPVLCVEGVRIPFLMATITARNVSAMTWQEIVYYSAATTICPLIPIVLMLRARRENGFATFWDLASGTRVVVRPKGAARPAMVPAAQPDVPVEDSDSLGPFLILREVVPGRWIVAADPVLRRQAWLLRREPSELPPERRNLSREGRLRWLQKVETAEATWDAFEAPPGVPFSSLVEEGKRLSWGTLRLWLHDMASELMEATRDKTLPAELSLDHVWITNQGHAVLLEGPWPEAKVAAESIPVGDLAGQQRFLNAIAAYVEGSGLPLHARPVLENLEAGKFERLSFLTGTLRGLLDKPAEVSGGMRAGSIFLIPLYSWVMLFVGSYRGEWILRWSDSLAGILLLSSLVILCVSWLGQLLELPFRSTAGLSLFRLVVVNNQGKPAAPARLLVRWAIVWIPLFLPMVFLVQRLQAADPTAIIIALIWIFLWICAGVYAVLHPNRGLHDRLAGTWIVRR